MSRRSRAIAVAVQTVPYEPKIVTTELRPLPDRRLRAADHGRAGAMAAPFAAAMAA